MFGYRKDGKKLKNIDPIIRLTSYIMKQRNDAQVEMEKPINCEGIDAFIQNNSTEQIRYGYMHIVIASIVRMLALRPRLNRFIMSGRVYARNKIYVSFVVKKKLSDDGDETTIKLGFTGHESLNEIREVIDREVENANVVKLETKTDKLAAKLLKLPHAVLSPAIVFLKMLDRFGLLPNSVVDASPFHTSVFLTNMKSIGTGHLFHHIYNFGTTGIFVAMGKEKMEPVVNLNNEIVPAKIMRLGIVIDERIVDGFYYAKSLKLVTKFLEDPTLLVERLPNVQVDPDL